MVPITDSEPALRGASVNQPPSGARRRTSSLAVIAAVTATTRTIGAIQVSTADYFTMAAPDLDLQLELKSATAATDQ